MARIIIADDDKLIHRIYLKIIDYLGHEVVSCYNGLEAVKAIEDGPADLIILDNMMPEMNGYDACQAIRKLPNGIAVPIIIVSADDSQDAILQFLNAGANDYILKPIREAILIAKLKNFLKTASLHKNELEMVREKVLIADQYKIEKVLGYGAHSIVFLAIDQKNDNRQVAVKFMNQNVVSEDLIAPITELLLKLQESDLENVIEIYDFGQYSGHVYVVLEYANGGDFASQLKKQGRLSEKEILKVGFDITRALVSLEKNNILHLDIKPENIMIHNGVYKLSDFGIVVHKDTTTMLLNPEIWGTLAYTSPEILTDNNNVSIKSDIYSFGVTLYEGVTGDNPFISEKPTVSMFRQVNLHPTSLLDMEWHFSIEVSVMIDMMLAKIPSLRPFPQDLEKTFSYMNECLNKQSVKQLTYFERPKKTVDEPLPRVIEKADEKIEEVLSDFSRATNVSLHTKNWKRTVALAMPALDLKEFNLKELFTKVILVLVIFFAIYFTIGVVQSIFTETLPKYDFKGIFSVVICEKCENMDEKPVIDIRESKCDECGGQDWYAIHCRQCDRYFPLNENKFNDDDLSIDDMDAELEKMYSCSFCNSPNTEKIDLNLKTEKK